MIKIKERLLLTDDVRCSQLTQVFMPPEAGPESKPICGFLRGETAAISLPGSGHSGRKQMFPELRLSEQAWHRRSHELNGKSPPTEVYRGLDICRTQQVG
jgi:hypothetical protein